MGKQLIWDDRYNMGINLIDKEHKKLFTIMNKIFNSRAGHDKKEWVYQEGIKYFKDHALKHFAEEEVYMASISYGGYETHKRLHDDFRNSILPKLERELERTRYSDNSVTHFLGVCAGWLIGHTLTEDQEIAKGGISKWANLVPKEELVALKHVITELVDRMFHLKAETISESYGGEKFGNGVYYRLTYETEDGQLQEIMLVFEEKLLIGTVGKIMGSKLNKLDVTLMNAVRYTARQFVQSVKEHFQSSDTHRLVRENLLTYDQFLQTFERRLPQYSLLFHTKGSGYFAYCAMTPYQLKGKLGASIQADNEMEEVKKYLAKNEQENSVEKKKILVVDDSDIFRELIKEMLEDDYQITLAQSGLSAIRCMILEKQDLVLLDYHMPNCDGEQLLKMIRSESELADIPVIFLSASADKERIAKLAVLKPAGYLLKSLPPLEIKKNIESYFKMKSGALQGV